MRRVSPKKPRTKPAKPAPAPILDVEAESPATPAAVAAPATTDLQPPTTPVETAGPTKAETRAADQRDHVASGPGGRGRAQGGRAVNTVISLPNVGSYYQCELVRSNGQQ